MFESQKAVTFENSLGVIATRKLDTALRASSANHYVKLIGEVDRPYDHRFLDKSIKFLTKQDRNPFTTNEHVLPLIFDKWVKIVPSKKLSDRLRHASSLAHSNLMIQMRSELSQVSGKLKRLIGWPNERWTYGKLRTLPKEIGSLFSVAHELESLVESLGKDQDVTLVNEEDRLSELPIRCTYESKRLDLKVAWSNTLAYIQTEEVTTIVPRPYILLLHNKIADILSVLLYAHLVDGNGLEEGTYDNTLKFIRSLMTIARCTRQRGYRVMKVLEALGTGLTLIDVDGPSNRAFLDDVISSLHEEYRIDITSYRAFSILEEASPPFRHELMCLSKVTGHPFVDMREGSKKLLNATREPLEIDHQLVMESVRFAKRSYIKAHVLTKGKWPPCHPIAQGLRLEKPWSQNKDPDSPDYTGSNQENPIPMEEYDLIEFLPNIRFDSIANMIPHLKDKTCSILRSRVIDKYIHKNNEKTSWSETRLLLYYLLHTERDTDHLAKLSKWCAEEGMTWEEMMDYLVIRIVPKEKELKEEYRGFGCKTPFDRARGVIQELNTGQYLDLYSSEQSMTLSEIEILKKLSTFRRIATVYTDFTPLYIVIDASKWNNKFRDETVRPVMEATLDKIFDVKIFSKTMQAYQNSFVYIPDVDGTYFWDGQEGGIEGLNQYTWDVCYLAQIGAVMARAGHDPILFAKGDDLRAIILISPDRLRNTTLDELRKRIVEQVSADMEKLGHTINVIESYGSTKYFAFSKAASIAAVEMPQTYRKIQKVYGSNNAFLPFLDDYIASAFSNSHSAAQTASNPVACYGVALVWSYWHLTEHPSYRRLTDPEYIALLLVPGVVGGLPIIYLHNIWTRGESDLLSAYIFLCQYCLRNQNEVGVIMCRFLDFDRIRPDKAFEGLLSDPYSLPIKKPVAPGTVLRKKIMPILKQKVKNEPIKALIRATNARASKLLVDTLYRSNVFSVKAMSAIFAASPQGLLQQFLRKFESARSILELIILRHGRKRAARHIYAVVTADKKVQEYRIKVIQGLPRTINYRGSAKVAEIVCPAQCAQYIRDETWDKKVETITMPPISHQITLQLELENPNDDWAAQSHFEYILDVATQEVEEGSLPWFKAGKCDPFLGYTTRSGLTTPSLHFLEKDEFINKVKTLIDLLSWVNLQDEDGTASNLPELIDILLALYLDVDAANLYRFQAKKRSGTQAHHVVSNKYKRSVVPNMLSNVASRFYGISNSNTRVRQSGHHYKINFLQIYCQTMAILSLKFQLSNVDYPDRLVVWGVEKECEFCLTPIVETPVVLEDPTAISGLYPPMHNLNLSIHAKQVLEESLAVDPREFLPAPAIENDIPIRYIMLGCLQYYFNRLASAKTRVANYHYHHSMDMGNFEMLSNISNPRVGRNLGDSELKRVTIESFYDYILTCAIPFIYDTWPNAHVKGISAMILSASYQDLPWYPVCDKLRHLGRLPEMIKYVERSTGYMAPAVEESPASAAAYIGIACFKAFHKSRVSHFPLVYVSDYEPGTLDICIRGVMSLMRRQLARTRLYNSGGNFLGFDFLDRRNTLDLRVDYTSLVVLYWSVPLVDPQFKDKLEEINVIHEVVKIPIFSSDDLDHEYLDDSFDDMHPIGREILRHHLFTDTEHGSLVTMAMAQLIEDYDYFRERLACLDRLMDDATIDVCVTSADVLIKNLRSRPVVKIYPDTNPLPRNPEVDLYQFVRIRQHPVFATLQGQGIANRLQIEAGEILPRTEIDEVILDPSYIYKAVGFGTASPSKLVDILWEVMEELLPLNASFACLGDGLGGFASTLSFFTQDSTFVFNSLTDHADHELKPASWTEENGNQITYQANLEGFSDLVQTETVQRIELVNPFKFLIITCDAQTIGMDMNSRASLLNNVIRFYLRNRTRGGLLILKLYIDELSLNHRAIALLKPYCRFIQLIKPRPSGINDEFYLIAAGASDVFLEDYSAGLPNRWISLADAMIYQEFANKVRSLWNDWVEGRSVITFGSRLSCGDQGTPLPCEALRRLRHKAGIDLEIDKFNRYCDSDRKAELIELCMDMALHSAGLYMDEFRDTYRPGVHRNAILRSSYFHRRRELLSRYAGCHGAYYILQTALTRPYDPINLPYIKECYRAFYRSINEPQLGLPPAEANFIYSRTFQVLESKWPMYDHFVEGMETVLMLLGYLNLPRMR